VIILARWLNYMLRI